MVRPLISELPWFVSDLSYSDSPRTVLAGTAFANQLVGVFPTPEEAQALVAAHNESLKEKGPASAATDPDHGSNNPDKENAVNEQHHSTAPVSAPPSLDFTLTAGAELLSHVIDKDKLKGFTIRELRDLYEGVILVTDVMAGLLCQPRYMQDGTSFYNAPGDGLDLLSSVAFAIADAVEDEAFRRPDIGGVDNEQRAWLLLYARVTRGDAEGPSGSGDFASLAAIVTGRAS